MATLESVKAKIQGLIEKSNETTGATDVDLTSAVNTLIDGYGVGGSDGTGDDSIVIDVEELPTENIDDSKIYKIIKDINITTIVTSYGETLTSLMEANAAQYGDIVGENYYVVDELPSNGNASVEDMSGSVYTTVYHIYIVRETGIPYITYDGISWVRCDEGITAYSLGNYNGVITNISHATDDGCYMLMVSSKEYIFGIPNAANDKIVYLHNGSEWTKAGKGITDVTSLPTTDIDDTTAYRLSPERNIYTYDSWSQQVYTLQDAVSQFSEMPSAKVKIYWVETLPEQMEVFDPFATNAFPVYVIESEGIGYISRTGSSDSATQLNGTVIHAEMYAPTKGWIDSIDSITEPGIYCIPGATNISMHTYSDGWANYVSEDRYEDLKQQKYDVETECVVLSLFITDESQQQFINATSFDRSAKDNSLILTSFNDKTIESIALPQGSFKIEQYAFQDCTALTSLVIPEGVNYVGYAAFKNCTSLRSIVFPSTVTYLDFDPFVGCTSLQTIDFTAATQKVGVSYQGGTNFLKDVPSTCKIIVPDALYSNWCNSGGWLNRKSQIVKASSVG